MKERPIIFSADSVRAILEGRKTQTRRVVKPQPKLVGDFYNLYGAYWGKDTTKMPCMAGHSLSTRNPYGQPGDRLWVRETWSGINGDIIYNADNPDKNEVWVNGGWKSSRCMPRWASRITLEITNVRVERLLEISNDDAKAEGVPAWHPKGEKLAEIDRRVRERNGWSPSYRNSYHELWDTINAKRGYPWGSNPWVWVVEFRKVQP